MYNQIIDKYETLPNVVQSCRHIVLATVNIDGSPHNSPMFFIPSKKLDKIYIGTHPQSLHAKNISRTGQAFGVIIGQPQNSWQGIYFKIENFHKASLRELPKALDEHNSARSKFDKQPLKIEHYKEPNPQRMYVGDIVEISINETKRDSDGRLMQDIRKQLTASQIL